MTILNSSTSAGWSEFRYRNQPEPFFETVERMRRNALTLVESTAPLLPAVGLISLISQLSFFEKISPFYSTEFFESISLVVRMIRSMDQFKWKVSGNLAAGLYYMMAENRGVRGLNPEKERNDHLAAVYVANDNPPIDARYLHFYCSLAINIGYETGIVDAQRLLHQQGLILLLGEIMDDRDYGHSFFLSLDVGRNEVILILPGTRNMGDVSTDMNGFMKPFSGRCDLGGHNPLTGHVHGGIEKISEKIFLEIFPLISKVMEKVRSRRLIITGHSLGAGIGVLLGLRIRQQQQRQSWDVYCYAFGCPPIVDSSLHVETQKFTTSVVLRDDFVCRASVDNVGRLLEEMTRESFTNRVWEYIVRDFSFMIRNLRFAWKLRQRSDALVESSTESSVMTPNPAVNKISGPLETVKTYLNRWIASVFVSHPPARMDVKDTPHQPMPACFHVPGRIIHIYQYHGLYYAGYVKCEFFKKISIQTEMVNDHFGENYLRALDQLALGVPIVDAPKWSSFSCSTCACCGSDFLWSSILMYPTVLPHKYMAQHNCRRCGRVVCDACSRKNRPIASLGINWPVRHCDICSFRPSRSKL